MSILSRIAEKKINQAITEGSFQPEKYKNKPLVIEDDSFVPEDLKIAHKMLKNAGYVPAEIETRKEIHNLEQLISKTEDEHTRVKQMRKLSFLVMKLDSQRSTPANLGDQEAYYDKIVERTTLQSKK